MNPPTKSGDYVKTDKKDAIKLARLHRAGGSANKLPGIQLVLS